MSTESASAPSLRRALSLPHAVIIGVGSMLGAGVFTVFGHAAAEAGGALLIALGLAAFVAFANATSSAQLAAVYPTSGGSYIFGREQLGPWRGFLAGWGFLIGKTASTAAMALTAAAYLVPGDSLGWPQRLAAAGIVLVIATINYRGVQRTATATAVIVGIVVAALAISIISGFTVSGAEVPLAEQLNPLLPETGVLGVVQAAGLFFFAFAGFARIATMGEEVTEPTKNIPRAILLALGTVLVLYVLISLMLLHTVGLQKLSGAPAPLAVAAGVVADESSTWSWLPVVIAPVAGLAACGALLALMTGIGRTTLAMARHDDLPNSLAAVHPKFGVPHRAEVILAAIVVVLVLTLDLRGAIGFSSFGVLLYYFIANWSALTQSAQVRRYPKALQIAGMIACVGIAFLQPLPAVIGGLIVFALGFGYRFWRQRKTVS
ncbi:APC family permease [Micrococcoides hystricis]|uniref:APC family permease n=1 Tax=Micrococcoides hystricis TaxID=1572761 RepID=A0ABV6PAH4_9MICC